MTAPQLRHWLRPIVLRNCCGAPQSGQEPSTRLELTYHCRRGGVTNETSRMKRIKLLMKLNTFQNVPVATSATNIPGSTRFPALKLLPPRGGRLNWHRGCMERGSVWRRHARSARCCGCCGKRARAAQGGKRGEHTLGVCVRERAAQEMRLSG